MVLLPFLIHTDSPEKVCVQLTHLNESVTLSATLEYQGENRSLIDDVVSEKDVFTCIPFSLPKSNSTSVAFLTVMVKGATLQFRSRKSVLVKNSESLVFVQTDKPIYKPGQTVLFRIVSLDKDFYPLNEKVDHNSLLNRVYQWQGVELETGLAQLSFPLTSDPIQGTYKIVVQKSFSSYVEHSFSVKEYVLPKYEVLVKLPKMITIKDKELPVSVCGLYTYGKPVPGLVHVQVCRKFSHSASNCYGKEAEAVCEEFTRQADARGCASGVVRTKIFQLQRRGYEMSIEVQGKITEDGTGIEMTGTGSCGITPIMSKISFDLLDSLYRPGIPLFGKADHKPELNCYDSEWITPSYEHAMRRINRLFFSLIAYGTFQLTFPVEATIAPLARMLVYTILPSGEVIASSADFQVESCLPNKVRLSFVPKEGLPASNTRLQLHTSPRSLCALRAVDKSVLLMKPEDELSPSSVSLAVSVTALNLLDDLDDEMAEHMGAGNPTETVRKYFPETWIWDIVSGNAALDVTIPDTITEWKANAFCTSADTGFGLSPTVSLRAFQPFFVELTLPYSVVRGESFTLKATVFNYLAACIRVSVSLAESTHFLATPVEKQEESYCICVNERKTVAWAVTPRSLGQVEFSVSTEALQNQQPCGNIIVETPEKGRKDTVIRQLLVEPEGTEVETTYNSVLCNLSHSPGDIMGTAMQNLHQLLQMPFGCGEQNMVLFAPNIYVLDYLNKTEQLSEEVKSKAIGYLVSGYQRQLKYKHWDGSYSTFGPRYGQVGNTWLTAFVLKSFAQARPHIFIDEKHIQDALVWLTQKQKENGCFRSSGTLLNNAMKGGVNDEITLTAYIIIALLEIPLPVTHSVVRNALFCLETAADEKENHVYTKALMAYAFALAGKEEKRKALLGSLEKEAVKKGECSWWDISFF
uniref:Alpha-2-macroglobulin n=1 Tax=Otus sunia TaxID=257818 RepID=A0A8C8AG84_9STRI